MENILQAIVKLQADLRACSACPLMIKPVVVGSAVVTPVVSIGQAPGEREGPAGKPFAWTAGKTLFKWFESIGVSEEKYRSHVYMAAVCRCFPGKHSAGGDRVPTKEEINNCWRWLEKEMELLHPKLLIPIGKLAITQLLPANRLVDVVGQTHVIYRSGRPIDVIALPHPSGLSTWFKTEPGKSLLQKSLDLISEHPAWIEAFQKEGE